MAVCAPGGPPYERVVEFADKQGESGGGGEVTSGGAV
jgi:hypothetical protein